MKVLFNSLVVGTVLALIPSLVSANLLTGESVLEVPSLSGTLSAINVDLGAGPVSTGLLTFSLDTSAPASNYIVDFDSATITANLNLLIDSPLLQSLGEPSAKIHIIESGSIIGGTPDLALGPKALNLTADLKGGGTVEPGSIFAGTTYSNINFVIIKIVVEVIKHLPPLPPSPPPPPPPPPPPEPYKPSYDPNDPGTVAFQVEAQITDPTGGSQPTDGSGSGSLTAVPEPSTFVLVVTAGIPLILSCLRRQHHHSVD